MELAGDKQESQQGQHVDAPAPAGSDGSIAEHTSDTMEGHSIIAGSLSRKAAKRRTKTGCLTCRKRRIKCGEEKPICSNCVKSKRECEGYSQPLVFKRPVGVTETFSSSQQSSSFRVQPVPMAVSSFNDYSNTGIFHQRLQTGSHLPILAPRPFEQPALGGQVLFPVPSTAVCGNDQLSSRVPFHYPQLNAITTLPQPAEAEPESEPWSANLALHIQPGSLPPSMMPQTFNGRLEQGYVPPSQYGILQPTPDAPEGASIAQNVSLSEAAYGTAYVSAHQLKDRFMLTEAPRPLATSATSFSSSSEQESMGSTGIEHAPLALTRHANTCYSGYSEGYPSAEPDVEMPDAAQREDLDHLSVIIASANEDESKLRSFTTHLNEPDILASYRPTFGSSPLNDPKAARIFAHFLHSTGPSLSIFERHPTDSSIILGARVPAAQQGLWTYTLPLMAFENQALLEAMLAVSSLHVSFLQQASSTPALKHYHYALRRIGTAVSLPLRRKQIGTLAAILLLGYYEVIAAEHTKWSSHMGGSSQLLREVDFATMTRDLRAYRRSVQTQREYHNQIGSWSAGGYFDNGVLEDDPFAEKEGSIDEDFIGSIIGRAVNYDQFGRVDDGKNREPKKNFSPKDIENCRILCDLYWWYNKQDIIQTLVSGNQLFTPYYRWGQCPPRAGIGRLDAIYGSADHLWLLLARLADFGYRDRKRKLRVIQTNGAEWRPGPGLAKFLAQFADGSQKGHVSYGRSEHGKGDASSDFPNHQRPGSIPPHQTRRRTSGHDTSQNSLGPEVEGRVMYGMIPPLGPAPVSSAVATGIRCTSELDEGNENEQHTSYTEAEHEWESIRIAFETFFHRLGCDFQPLAPDSTPPISTPFGPALQYRTNTIATIWGYYYAGCIILRRFHPSMPPAMMVAAGVAATTTSEYCQIVGRIAGGVYYPQRYNLQAGSLNPNLGSCLIELTVPLYFSAVQYTDFVQRKWIVTHLREVSRLTGWETANVIARGCESAWIVAAKQGRGPPYERMWEYDEDTPFNASQKRDGSSSQGEGCSERRFVAISNASRKHWAMGILSLEDDVLSLETDERR